jgi:two-component system chemotaxis response regulator CheB
MIKVLIVDDSASMRLFLEQIFSADPGIEVVGTAKDGEEALAAVESLAPDVITMDIYMPRMNGLEATRRIMETHPTPIIILSGNLEPEETMYSFRALEAGALTALAKPHGVGHPDHELESSDLVRKLKLMAEVKVVKRWPQPRKAPAAPVPAAMISAEAPEQPQAVAIGASTGGPVVIQSILAGLSRTFPLPVLIVQHMAPGFTPGFAEWLALSSALPVHIARQGECLLSGHAYIAPDGSHLLIEPGGRIALSAAPPENGLRPAVGALFRSVADVYGKSVIGILLTGMGKDGVQELLLMKQKGAITIAQDQASSVIFGMPGEAVSIGAATYVLSPDSIVTMLEQLAKKGLANVLPRE